MWERNFVMQGCNVVICCVGEGGGRGGGRKGRGAT